MTNGHAMAVEGYGKIEVTVPAQGSTQVEVQPWGAGQVRLLLISAREQKVGVEYEVDSSGTSIALDSPQYLGAGSVSVLGAVRARRNALTAGRIRAPSFW